MGDAELEQLLDNIESDRVERTESTTDGDKFRQAVCAEKRRSRDLPADVRPIESARLDALDELLFRRTYLPSAVSIEVLDQNQRSLEHQYIAMKFAHPGPPICPTLIGVL